MVLFLKMAWALLQTLQWPVFFFRCSLFLTLSFAFSLASSEALAEGTESLFPRRQTPFLRAWQSAVACLSGGQSCSSESAGTLAPAVAHQRQLLLHDAKARRIFKSWTDRLPLHGAMLTDVLKAQGIPEELVCVPMVESGLRHDARSPAGAVGMWQLVGPTAQRYELQVSHWVDERLDPELATRAAGLLLRSLHQRFGSWELALAAYNWGSGAVYRALTEHNTNDFWHLAEMPGVVPEETRQYVPRVMACGALLKEQKALEASMRSTPTGAFALVAVPSQLALSWVADVTGLALEDVAELNGMYVRGQVPPEEGKPWFVKVPAAHASRLRDSLEKLQQTMPRFDTHVVAPGETWETLSLLYAVAPEELQRRNHMQGEQLAAGTTLLTARGHEGGHPRFRVNVLRLARVPLRTLRRFYVVRPADSLAFVAKQLAVSTADLRVWNRLAEHAALHRGMVLQVFIEPEEVFAVPLLHPKDVELRRSHGAVYGAAYGAAYSAVERHPSPPNDRVRLRL